jgi:hypothetical protein
MLFIVTDEDDYLGVSFDFLGQVGQRLLVCMTCRVSVTDLQQIFWLTFLPPPAQVKLDMATVIEECHISQAIGEEYVLARLC